MKRLPPPAVNPELSALTSRREPQQSPPHGGHRIRKRDRIGQGQCLL